MVRDGHEVTLLCAKTDVTDPDFQDFEGVKIYCRKVMPDSWIRQWPYPHYFPLAISKFLLGWHLKKLHSREKFDFIREDMAPVPVSGIWALFRFKGARRILVVHNLPETFSNWRQIYGFLYGGIGYLFELLLRGGVLRFDKILSASLFTATSLEKLPRLSGKVKVVYNGIHLSDFVARTSGEERAVTHRFLFVGRLVSLKGLSFLLEAFAKLNRKVPFASLCIIGDGPDRARLQVLTENLKIDRQVEFRGEIAHDKAIKAYQEFDYFVMPSTFEGFSIVTLEAMASGLPLLLSDIPGFRDIVDDDGALFFSAEDSDDLAKKLCWAIENPAAMQAKADNALSIVRRFDWEKVFEQEVAAMKEVGLYV